MPAADLPHSCIGGHKFPQKSQTIVNECSNESANIAKPVLKKSCKNFCESHWNESELMDTWRKYANKAKSSSRKKRTQSLSDDLIDAFNRETENLRIENAIWRRWSQKRHNLPVVDSSSLGLSSLKELDFKNPKRTRRVSFKEVVEQRIIPNNSVRFEEEYLYEEADEEPSLLQHVSGFILNTIVGISSFLSPYSTQL